MSTANLPPPLEITWRDHLGAAAVPLLLGFTTLGLALVWEPLGLPEVAQIAAAVEAAYLSYGMPALALFAFFEACFMLGLYVPGSFAILTGVAVLADQPQALLLLSAICWAAFMAAMAVNWAIGRYGIYHSLRWLGAGVAIERGRAWFAQWGLLTFVLTAWHPNYLGIAVTTAGANGQSLGRTLLICGALLAVVVPGMIFLLAALIGGAVTSTASVGMNAYYAMVGILFSWALLAIGRSVWHQRLQRKSSLHAL